MPIGVQENVFVSSPSTWEQFKGVFEQMGLDPSMDPYEQLKQHLTALPVTLLVGKMGNLQRADLDSPKPGVRWEPLPVSITKVAMQCSGYYHHHGMYPYGELLVRP